VKPINFIKLAEICWFNCIDRRSLGEKGVLELEITNVCIDSRKVTPGSVFFAIKGENHDGHNYLEQAFENGAACAVISDQSKSISRKPIICVADTITALGRLAKYVRQNSSYKVVALTGSAGKTTTKNIISHILKNYFECYSSPKSFNNNIGVPLTILDAPQDTEILISELGSNHPGEIAQLTKIIQPDIAAITTICPAHLEGFGSVNAIIKEKVSITAGLNAGGKFFVNGNIEKLVDYCRDKNLPFETFGVSDCKLEGDKSTFVIDNVTVHLPLAGRANVENAMAAWAVCKSLGISAKEFAEAIVSIKPVDMRLEILQLEKGVAVIADCYNANPGSMANAIETLSLMAKQKDKRAVFIFGRMGELGDHSERLHAELGEKIAQYEIPVALTIKGDCSIAAATAEKYANYGISVNVFENLVQLCDNLHKIIKPDDIILIKASRSERFEAVIDKLKGLFIGRQ